MYCSDMVRACVCVCAILYKKVPNQISDLESAYNIGSLLCFPKVSVHPVYAVTVLRNSF